MESKLPPYKANDIHACHTHASLIYLEKTLASLKQGLLSTHLHLCMIDLLFIELMMFMPAKDMLASLFWVCSGISFL